jgi:Raf kinase inhibitor-like YbhB/YbcL family protein
MTPTVTFTSSAFAAGSPIPMKFTCEGDNMSPALAWGPAPEGARSWALIFDDPDDTPTTWSHWIVFNLPPEARGLGENILPSTKLPGGAIQGTNDFKKIGYGGPCPPTGTHRYTFRLYALDRTLDLTSAATRGDVLQAIEGHVVAQAELVGTYIKTKAKD